MGVGNLVRALKTSLRSLVKSPGFTIPAVLILAIGISGATATFTVVDSIAFRPLDLPESDRIVILCEEHARLSGFCIASPSNTEDLRAASTLESLGFGRGWAHALSDESGDIAVRGGLGTRGFFEALGVRPTVGRLFAEDEVGPGRDHYVLLSHAFWTTRYGADPSVIGSVVRLEEEPYEVVGVLPQGFEAPFDLTGIQVWTPPHFDPFDPDVRGWRGFRAIGRLAPGVEIAAARSELETLYAGLDERFAEIDDEWRLRVAPLLEVVVGDTRTVLLAFLAAATLLLVIVCANVANLLLARGLGRKRELAVRAALGADRARLVRGILAESLLLAALATAAALAVASGATRAIVALAPPEVPRLGEVSLDGGVILFASLMCLAATAAFAVLPALRVTSWNLGETMRSGGREGEGRRTHALRDVLVGAELAVSVVLLVAAALLGRSFKAYLDWEPGFDREPLIAVSAGTNTGKYDSLEQVLEMYRRAEEQIAAIPGVASVATASAGPLFGGGDGRTPFVPEGWDGTAPLPTAAWFDVGPGFFETLDVPVLRGREISEDDRWGGVPVAVVNESFAELAFSEGRAVGRTVELPEREQQLQIVGVVADVVPLRPGEPPRPEVYWSNRQAGRPFTFFLVRASGEPTALVGAIEDAVASVDPGVTLGTPRTLVSQERRELVRPRFQLVVLLAFGLAGLILSAIGVYAVVSYSVARRVREIGIRMALGAAGSDVLGHTLLTSLRPTSLGIVIGLVGSLLVGRLLRSLIPGVSPLDPVSIGGAAACLLAAAVVAALVPAARATRADPVRAMRAD